MSGCIRWGFWVVVGLACLCGDLFIFSLYYYRWNYALSGLNPWSYHAVNVMLHAAVSALFAWLCRNCLGLSKLSSLLTASLFAIHPIHTEAVTTLHFPYCIVYKIPICVPIYFWGVFNGLNGIQSLKSAPNFFSTRQQDYHIPFQTVRLVSRLSTLDESNNWNDLRGFQWWHFQYYYYTHWLSAKRGFWDKRA